MRLPNGLEVAHLGAREALYLYDEIFVRRRYAHPAIALRPGDRVLDVGANIGVAAIWFAAQAPGVEVHSFEPQRAAFAALRENLEHHAVPGAAYELALGARPGRATLSSYRHNTICSTLHPRLEEDVRTSAGFLARRGVEPAAADQIAGFLFADVEQVECQVEPLSDVLARIGIGEIGLLKVDVERSELEVLSGVRDGDWPRIRQLVMELQDRDGALAAATDLLEDRGFTVHVEQDPLLGDSALVDVYCARSGP
jgi:FkbM family methyltransferase